MSDIFQEVDEALQEDKAKELWKEWGSTIITAAVVMVLTTAAFSGFRTWQSSTKEKETSRIIAALESEDPASALVEITDSSKKGHQSIAVLAAAGQHLGKGDMETALSIYQDAIANNIMLDDFEDLARIMSVRIHMQLDSDKTAGAEMLETLEPVMKDKSSPWTSHARVEAAMIEAHHNNAPQSAADLLDEVMKSDATPPDLLERARAMMHVFKLRAAEQSTETEDSNQAG
ncbi:MAG: tetratricopeptide repeat protein [Pseudomonadota bacterium]